MSRSEKRAIASPLVRLLLHLLKWKYQPRRRSDSWLDFITDPRLQIDLAVQDSPSLSVYPTEQLERCYQKARRSAVIQTKLPPATFPEQCPFALGEILDEGWLPD